jgi:hypothetical protein
VRRAEFPDRREVSPNRAATVGQEAIRRMQQQPEADD